MPVRNDLIFVLPLLWLTACTSLTTVIRPVLWASVDRLVQAVHKG